MNLFKGLNCPIGQLTPFKGKIIKKDIHSVRRKCPCYKLLTGTSRQKMDEMTVSENTVSNMGLEGSARMEAGNTICSHYSYTF
jgi:hypothetical protein